MRKLIANKISPQAQAQAQASHRVSMMASLERRMEVARSKGDTQLLNLLEAEKRQLS
ncbi:hypothetical protein [Leptolyngbya sp. FACHB-261]|uniref:arginine synthesis PII-interacting regulator PirA n=1 Tax=Leptolyngbya sp. FACHB-261 TaxID=2692806 RepID=UPI001689EBF9|nr:hypothetical protein [Leptolyngbya sp. FACHB-261]MBD2099918.1 hypothetical protein [Leptolyngbya sp. FACHB-261]